MWFSRSIKKCLSLDITYVVWCMKRKLHCKLLIKESIDVSWNNEWCISSPRQFFVAHWSLFPGLKKITISLWQYKLYLCLRYWFELFQGTSSTEFESSKRVKWDESHCLPSQNLNIVWYKMNRLTKAHVAFPWILFMSKIWFPHFCGFFFCFVSLAISPF